MSDRELEKGKLLEKTACPKCGSNDNLCVYEKDSGKIDGYCRTPDCGYTADPYGDNPPAKKPSFSLGKVGKREVWDLDNIGELATKDLTDRGIPAYIATWYGVKSAVNTTTGMRTDDFFPRTVNGEIVAYKRRPIGNKKGTRVVPEGAEAVDLIGMELARTCSRKALVITEGEYDMMAAQYMLQMYKQDTKWKGQPAAVVSVPDGADSVTKVVKRCYEFINEFDKVIYVRDNDAPGKKGEAAFGMACPPGKAFVVDYPGDDPNDTLLSGRGKEFSAKLLFENKRWSPPAMLSASDLIDKASTVPEYGLRWPWSSLDEKTFGIYPGMYMWGAGAGVGKTTIMMQLTDWLTSKYNRRVGLFYLEQEPDLTLRRLSGFRDNQIYHLPSFKFDPTQLRATNEAIGREDKIRIYDPAEFRVYDDVVENITMQVRALGVKDIILDNLTVATASAEDQRVALDDMVRRLSIQALELGFTIHIISHLNRQGGGDQGHEGGADVKQHHFRGSGGLQYWPNHMIGLIRDTENESNEIKSILKIKWLKDRKSGFATGHRSLLKYDKDIGNYRDASDAEEKAYYAAIEQQKELKREEQGGKPKQRYRT